MTQNRIVLRKFNDKKRFVGRLVGIPVKGRKLVLDLGGGDEYVTSPIVRMLQMVNDGTMYIGTLNSHYSLRVKR